MPAVGRGAEVNLAVVRPLVVPATGGQEDVGGARAPPGPLIRAGGTWPLAAGALPSLDLVKVLGQQRGEERRQVGPPD
jgi:hypothetical protein